MIIAPSAHTGTFVYQRIANISAYTLIRWQTPAFKCSREWMFLKLQYRLLPRSLPLTTLVWTDKLFTCYPVLKSFQILKVVYSILNKLSSEFLTEIKPAQSRPAPPLSPAVNPVRPFSKPLCRWCQSSRRLITLQGGRFGLITPSP